ncbi:hypothetical protein ACFQ36_17450 [Arthrobacter sp. GCM10027362]
MRSTEHGFVGMLPGAAAPDAATAELFAQLTGNHSRRTDAPGLTA